MRKISLGLLSGLTLAMAMPVMAQVAPKAIPQFVPAGSWTVKPAITGDSRQFKSLKLPCMMMTEFDNGYILRLSGGEGNIMAMAVDFRQNAFVQGRKYKTELVVSGKNLGYIEATAFSKNALIINTRNVTALYQNLSFAKHMMINVEGNAFEFTLGNIQGALSSLESCYSGKPMSVPVALTSMGATPLVTPPAPGKNEAMAVGEQSAGGYIGNGIAWENTRARISTAPTNVTMPKEQPRRERPPMIWRAASGDSLKATLTRWANKANVDIDWQADLSGNVVSDVALTSDFESAVQTLIAQNAAATGIQANLFGGNPQNAMQNPMPSPMPMGAPTQSVSRMPTPLIPASTGNRMSSQPRVSSMSPMMAPSGAPSIPVPPAVSTWQANQGANLRIALEEWSKRAGVELLWQANQSFAVRQSVANNGSYESALESVLGQYINDSVRPIGQLNNDPISGRRILIIQTSNVL